MTKKHVGRPTNEEISLRKKKQLLKVLLPISLIAIVLIMVIGNSGLKELMGNEVYEESETSCNYSCDAGWTLDSEDNNVCYQETSDTYLLGDADQDNKVTLKDFEIIKKVTMNNTELDYKQKIIYDVNGDGEVNEEDITGFSTSSTVADLDNTNEITCPKDMEKEEELDGEEALISVSYSISEDQNICQASIKVKKEKVSKSDCQDEDEIEEEAEEDTDTEKEKQESIKSASKSRRESFYGYGVLTVKAWNHKLCGKCKKKNRRGKCIKKYKCTSKGGKHQKKEPCADQAIKYWSKQKILKTTDFVYPRDKKTGKPLGAWPKDYKNYYTQWVNYKKYHKYYMWPVTPLNGVYTTGYPHKTMDVATTFATPVYSPVSGTLVYSEWGHTGNKDSDETAYSITIRPKKTIKYKGIKINEIFLTHLSGIRYRCKKNKCHRKVKAGQLLGFTGNATGNDSGDVGWAPHLHMTFCNKKTCDNDNVGLFTPALEKFYRIKNNKKITVGH